MTNDLGSFLLVTLCLFGGITPLLLLLAAVDPQTDRLPPRADGRAPTLKRSDHGAAPLGRRHVIGG
jgi:hypothetical protein